ncbi:MAG: HAD-IA family hydrolase [Clostridiales bacterium]|nr:HAD-IA family hydrolase [Clostridiales bacterium]
MLKYLLFDLDGTLIDSSRCIFKVYTDIFSELNIPKPDDDTMKTFIGPSIEQTIGLYYDGDIKAACTRFREIYKTVDLKEYNSLFPGVRKMLATLKDDGYILALATSKFYYFTNQILEIFDIKQYFSYVQGSNGPQGIITKADVIRALFSMGVQKDKCMLIGDTKYDIEGAKEAGIPVGIVKYGFGVASDFENADVLWYANSACDIVDKVRSTKL